MNEIGSDRTATGTPFSDPFKSGAIKANLSNKFQKDVFVLCKLDDTLIFRVKKSER
jgi:hypothetical protein